MSNTKALFSKLYTEAALITLIISHLSNNNNYPLSRTLQMECGSCEKLNKIGARLSDAQLLGTRGPIFRGE